MIEAIAISIVRSSSRVAAIHGGGDTETFGEFDPDCECATCVLMSLSQLYLGDNLDFLRDRERIPAESVDLVYLDPPFNSDRTYNTLFEAHQVPASDEPGDAQRHAFEDTWTWDRVAQRAYDNIDTDSSLAPVKNAIQAFCREFPRSDMAAYLVMMAERLVDLHSVLKPTGSLYLHCDSTASPYLRLMLDSIFRPQNFRSEIIWKRTHSHGDPKRNFGAVTDSILFYTKSSEYMFNPQYRPFTAEYAARRFTGKDADGRRWQSVTLRSPQPRENLRYDYRASNGKTYPPHRNGWSCELERMKQYDRQGRLHFPAKPGGQLRLKMYLDESKGVKIQNLWDDIFPVNSQAAERVGYPTQKPLALLERIIAVSSRPGDVVLDPFCGCGTTIDAAQKMGRRWIGIDLAIVAIEVIEKRLGETHGKLRFEFDAIPRDAKSAIFLADRSIRYHTHKFQEWVVNVLGGEQTGGRKPKAGGDQGKDGLLRFRYAPGRTEVAIIQAKGGMSIGPGDVRDLLGTMTSERAPVGVLFTAHPPTPAMKKAAAAAGTVAFEGWADRYPRVQMISAADWFSGRRVKLPGQVVAPHNIGPADTRPGETYVIPGLGIEPMSGPRGVVVQLDGTTGKRKSPKSAPAARGRRRAHSDQD